jgi:hypothetical protein
VLTNGQGGHPVAVGRPRSLRTGSCKRDVDGAPGLLVELYLPLDVLEPALDQIWFFGHVTNLIAART